MYKGWKVALAGLCINILTGVPYAWSIFASSLSRDLGWTHTQAALPYTVFLFCYAPAMALTGGLQDRFGPRVVIITGGVLVGIASILSAFFLTPLGVTLLWGVLWGLGVACCFASVTPAAIKWFPPERKGFVTGIVVFGMGFSAFIMAPLVHLLLSQQGLQQTFLLIGAVLLVGVLFLAQLVENPPRENSAHSGDPGGTKMRVSQSPWEIFRHPQFYMLWVMFFLTTGTGVTFVTHMDTIARVHASFEMGFIIVSLFAFFNACGRIAIGFLSDRVGRDKAMTLVFTAMALIVGGLLLVESPLMLAISVSLLGLFYGGLFSLFPATTASFFGEENFGLFYGLIFTALAAGGLFPLLAGYLFELQGDFSQAFKFLVVACLTAVLLSFLVKRLGAPRL